MNTNEPIENWMREAVFEAWHSSSISRLGYERIIAKHFANAKSDSDSKTSKITERELESILIKQGLVQAAAIEDPEGYDGGRTSFAIGVVARQINDAISTNAKGSN